jgi:hypothetical protein
MQKPPEQWFEQMEEEGTIKCYFAVAIAVLKKLQLAKCENHRKSKETSIPFIRKLYLFIMVYLTMLPETQTM